MVRPMTEVEWNPDTYLDEMRAEIPGYEELEDAVAQATRGFDAESILELGTGTGETALRVLALHPGARWTGIDSSEPMLASARERLPGADLRLARLEDPLPEGPFDLAVSVLTVHHLDAAGKRDLFARLAGVTNAFVLGDVVVPEDPADAAIEIDGVYDVPSTVAEQLEWLRAAGFAANATSVRPDLAVFTATRRVEESPVFRRGGISYLRIPSPKPRESAAFYEAVFGWRLRGDPERPSFDDGTGHVIGHFMDDLDVAGDSGFRPFVFVASVADALEKVVANGGEIVREPYPEGDLTVAVFRDPAGNVAGVWQLDA
jgi:tRNA (cmo5U34)-methyltransferase